MATGSCIVWADAAAHGGRRSAGARKNSRSGWIKEKTENDGSEGTGPSRTVTKHTGPRITVCLRTGRSTYTFMSLLKYRMSAVAPSTRARTHTRRAFMVSTTTEPASAASPRLGGRGREMRRAAGSRGQTRGSAGTARGPDLQTRLLVFQVKSVCRRASGPQKIFGPGFKAPPRCASPGGRTAAPAVRAATAARTVRAPGARQVSGPLNAAAPPLEHAGPLCAKTWTDAVLKSIGRFCPFLSF